MTEGRLIVMRHGQTQYNAEHRMTGRADIDLTETGVAQAKRAGAVVKHLDIDVLYASTLKRAFNTMAIAMEASNSNEHLKDIKGEWNINKRDCLVEKCVGDYTGALKTSLKGEHSVQTYDSNLPNGETNRDVVNRIQEFYDTEVLPLLAEGKTVFVSCHSVVVKAFMVVLGETTGENMHKAKVPNAQPWVIEYKDGKKQSSFFVNPEKFDTQIALLKKGPTSNRRP